MIDTPEDPNQTLETHKQLIVHLDRFSGVLSTISKQMEKQTTILNSMLKENLAIKKTGEEKLADERRSSLLSAASKDGKKATSKSEGGFKSMLSAIEPKGGFGSMFGLNKLMGMGLLLAFSPAILEFGKVLIGAALTGLGETIKSGQFQELLISTFTSGLGQLGLGTLLFGPKFLLAQTIITGMLTGIEKYFDTNGDGVLSIAGMNLDLDSLGVASTVTLIASALLSVASTRLLARLGGAAIAGTAGWLMGKIRGTPKASPIAQSPIAANKVPAGPPTDPNANKTAARTAAISKLTPEQLAKLEEQGYRVNKSGSIINKSGQFVKGDAVDNLLSGLKKETGVMSRLLTTVTESRVGRYAKVIGKAAAPVGAALGAYAGATNKQMTEAGVPLGRRMQTGAVTEGFASILDLLQLTSNTINAGINKVTGTDLLRTDVDVGGALRDTAYGGEANYQTLLNEQGNAPKKQAPVSGMFFGDTNRIINRAMTDWTKKIAPDGDYITNAQNELARRSKQLQESAMKPTIAAAPVNVIDASSRGGATNIQQGGSVVINNWGSPHASLDMPAYLLS